MDDNPLNGLPPTNTPVKADQQAVFKQSVETNKDCEPTFRDANEVNDEMRESAKTSPDIADSQSEHPQ